jgi:hypothetical protein
MKRINSSFVGNFFFFNFVTESMKYQRIWICCQSSNLFDWINIIWSRWLRTN